MKFCDLCGLKAAFRVEHMNNPSNLPGLGKVVRRKACGVHLTKLVHQALTSNLALSPHVHVLPIDSTWDWVQERNDPTTTA